jgi:hypothetical protein
MYRSGRSPDWLKMTNADAPAVKREAEEEWGKKKRAVTTGKNRIMIFGPKTDGTHRYPGPLPRANGRTARPSRPVLLTY